MKYFVHYIKSEIWAALFNVNYLSSNFIFLKLQFRHIFPNSSLVRFKIGIFWVLVYFQVFPRLTKRIWGFSMLLSLDFWFFLNSLKHIEIRILKVPLITYVVRLWGSSAIYTSVKEKGGLNLWLNCQFLRKIGVHIYHGTVI